MMTPGPDHATPSTIFERHPRKTLILVVLFSVLALDLAAGYLLLPKNYNDFREPHPYYHHGLLANREARSKWGSGEEYTVFTNSLGLMDEAVREVSLSTDKHRIVFIGDSYTEGIGVPFEKTFVGRLSQKVDRDRVEILNAGVSSYCAKLYYLKTKYLVEEVGLKFDELYVFIDISDIQDEILYRDFQSSKRTLPGHAQGPPPPLSAPDLILLWDDPARPLQASDRGAPEQVRDEVLSSVARLLLARWHQRRRVRRSEFS